MVPIVQLKVLETLPVNDILGLVPLQIVKVAALVIAGAGLTVTVMAEAAPAQEPDVVVGVTRYCTVPADELTGLVSV